ncbi:MAG: hypothetical protein PHH13_05690 [Candidatus Peribacteraceae bacterium]|nr:hypothetical protein [Candidatus Peribacteraceae bacterium]
MRTYIGIDPGCNGGIAVITTPSNEGQAVMVETYNMPETEKDIADLFLKLSHGVWIFALIEKVGSMPGNAARAMFTFGRGYGALRMAMICREISFDEVPPQTWQKAIGVPPRKKTETKTQHKNKLKAKAQQLYPNVRVTLANADAILIADYLRRISLSPH